jgi:uncharacterized membrane protein
MAPLLIFKLVTFSMIGLCAFTALSVLLVSAKKERNLGPPVRGVVTLAFVVAGICAALALIFAYQVQKQIPDALRLERVELPNQTQSAGAMMASTECIATHRLACRP